MLSQQDFNMLESMMVRVVSTAIKDNNAEMKAYIDERFEKNNVEMKAYIDERLDERFEKNNAQMKEFVKESIKEAIKESESFLLDEIERFYNFAKRDIQKLSAKVDEIVEYYRIRKNEESRYDYVIRLYHKQQQEINEIRQVLAM